MYRKDDAKIIIVMLALPLVLATRFHSKWYEIILNEELIFSLGMG